MKSTGDFEILTAEHEARVFDARSFCAATGLKPGQLDELMISGALTPLAHFAHPMFSRAQVTRFSTGGTEHES